MADIEFKQKEAKTIRFTLTEDGVAVDATGATFKFCIKKTRSDASYTIEKEDADFDKTDIATGIVTCPLSATDTDIDAGNYFGELKTMVSGSDVDKSQTFVVKVNTAIVTD